MRKLIAFFKRFRVFLVFFILQVIALTSYSSVMSFPRTRFLNSSATIVAQLLTWERNIIKYLYLDEENVKLQEQNIKLENQLPHNFISIDQKTAIIEDTIKMLSFERATAKVINSSHRYRNNYFTIDAGTERGIQRKMGAVTAEGVVGIVYDVSKHYAVVKSILTSDINISAYIEGINAFGIIKYDGEDPRTVQLTGISNDIEIELGSEVKTRGSGGYFPQGISIGTIEDIQPIEGAPRWEITVKLSQDMRTMRYVYIIKNIHQLELNELESNIKELQ